MPATANAPTTSTEHRSIEHVLARLDGIVDWARSAESPAGYFAALYRRVTHEVKLGIEAGFFSDGPRMEHLDVVFAQRYLDAFDAWRAGAPPTRADPSRTSSRRSATERGASRLPLF